MQLLFVKSLCFYYIQKINSTNKNKQTNKKINQNLQTNTKKQANKQKAKPKASDILYQQNPLGMAHDHNWKVIKWGCSLASPPTHQVFTCS